MNKQNVVYIYGGVLFNIKRNKKELSKQMKILYNENYKTLLKEIKDIK